MEFLSDMPTWSVLVAILIGGLGGGGVHKLYAVYSSDKQSVLGNLMTRISQLEEQQKEHDLRYNELFIQYNKLYRHVAYLEAKLALNQIKFTHYTEKEENEVS